MPNEPLDINTKNSSEEYILYVAKLRNSIWNFGVASWLFGITDRSFATLADGYLSPPEILQLLIASFFLMSWLFLKPEIDSISNDLEKLEIFNSNANLQRNRADLCTVAQSRMLELQKYHLISQEYVLPFSYLSQIYHLLNLKHLETVHRFSLSGLKVIKASHFRSTNTGGILKFQTILASSVNALRIWRQPIVEVGLVLHTSYTVELRIPVYNGKMIVVVFNAIPLSANEHKFLIDIYSNLDWPKPLLQMVLHFASCLTLWEDLPYLRKLNERNIHHFMKLNPSNQEMQLLRRFVDVYGSSLTPSESEHRVKPLLEAR